MIVIRNALTKLLGETLMKCRWTGTIIAYLGNENIALGKPYEQVSTGHHENNHHESPKCCSTIMFWNHRCS